MASLTICWRLLAVPQHRRGSMFKANESDVGPGLFPASGLLCRASILALLVPIAAFSGVSGIDDPDSSAAAVASKPSKSVGNLQIRCWQGGHLLFEADHVALPLDGGQNSVRAIGMERRGQALLVADTKNATCLIRDE